ncbi:hypothetical protein TW95_gp1109 [Pandoravirus inopinatum]|uniref:Transmembrane protein n=1 Tax=Pandoravirus inopinatum TaxID=1605721 RepID=A0A0B5IYB5_9VIRU|nr:hypothetical protein TW95_gp1109 [Pandoravirus inopinatum]AJF97843.1 hypothetical protein [Pandoravirus inopinatum]
MPGARARVCARPFCVLGAPVGGEKRKWKPRSKRKIKSVKKKKDNRGRRSLAPNPQCLLGGFVVAFFSFAVVFFAVAISSVVLLYFFVTIKLERRRQQYRCAPSLPGGCCERWRRRARVPAAPFPRVISLRGCAPHRKGRHARRPAPAARDGNKERTERREDNAGGGHAKGTEDDETDARRRCVRARPSLARPSPFFFFLCLA